MVALVSSGKGQVIRADPAAGLVPSALADRPFACRKTVPHLGSHLPPARHNRYDRKTFSSPPIDFADESDDTAPRFGAAE
jgi:hypothetical protein